MSRRPRRRTGARGPVLWPLAVGLAFCGLGLWSGLVIAHNQAAFRAGAVPAKAVIDQTYAGAGSVDLYGTVSFEAGGKVVHARVPLGNCSGTCLPAFRPGQQVTVYYNPENPGYARLRSGVSGKDYFWLLALGLLGAVFLTGAVVNVMTRSGRADEHPARERSGNRPLIDVDPDRFEAMVGAALDDLPEDLGRLMRNVAVTVEHDQGPPGLLGRYRGVPLTSRTENYTAVLPDKITIYRQAICAICRSEREVAEEVRRTVIHEVAHHFGIDDDRLTELGW